MDRRGTCRAAARQNILRRFNRFMSEVTKFRCPNCQAEYKVVRVEVPPTRNEQLLCLSRGAPLHNREGKFARSRSSISESMTGGRCIT